MNLREYVEDTRDNWPDYEVQLPTGLALALLDAADAGRAITRYAPSNSAAEVRCEAFPVIELMRALAALDREVASW